MKVLAVLLTHYRRHPVQALFLLAGIIIANVLLAGTLLINAQARASYERGEQLLSDTPFARIRHAVRGQTIDERDYIDLRRQGYNTLVPVLRQVVRTGSNQALELMGIDILAIPRSGERQYRSPQRAPGNSNFMEFAFPPYQLWAAPARIKQLGVKVPDRIPLASGDRLPPLAAVPGRQLGHRLLMDIKALQELTGNRGNLTSILVFPAPPGQMEQLQGALPRHLEFSPESDAPDPAEMTRSFHLNLAAMGLLAFVVGIFLMYNALAFSYTDRRELMRRLRLAGVLKMELRSALLLELTLFLVSGMLIGSWLGAVLAGQLLPGVGQTLAQLYGVYISYPDGLVPSGIGLPVVMTLIAAGLCVLFPLREALNAPMLERRQSRWQQAAVKRRDRLLAITGLLLLLGALMSGRLATSLWQALAGMACLLLGAALTLPAVLRTLIDGLGKLVPERNARLSWLLADSRWLLGPASLALMAMTLALLANSGLNTMIFSFRAATSDWLNQRLAAELYLRGEQGLGDLESWLSAEMPELSVARRYRTAITGVSPASGPVAVEVVSLRDGERFQNSIRLMNGADSSVKKFQDGEGIYISERAWRIDGWHNGDLLTLCERQAALPVLGIYRDYGNPQSQWMVSRKLFEQCWPDQAVAGLAVHGPPNLDWNRVRTAIAEQFNLEEDEIINQRELKQIGLAVFDRTFVVTHALNTLTLLVAAIGIFCAVSAIHHHRVGQQALLASLGINRRERGFLLFLQWGLLGLLCTVLVWPFGTALAAYLAGVVTPVAFGWSFPLRLDWLHYLVLAALACSCLILAVLLPSLRLLFTSPANMLREQNL